MRGRRSTGTSRDFNSISREQLSGGPTVPNGAEPDCAPWPHEKPWPALPDSVAPKTGNRLRTCNSREPPLQVEFFPLIG